MQEKTVGFFLSFLFNAQHPLSPRSQSKGDFYTSGDPVGGVNLSFSRMYSLYFHSLASDASTTFVIHSWKRTAVQLQEPNQ